MKEAHKENFYFPLPKIIWDFVFSIISNLVFMIKEKQGHYRFVQHFPLGNITRPQYWKKLRQWGGGLTREIEIDKCN